MKSQPERSEPTPASTPRLPAKKRIYVVDDHPVVRAGLALLLSAEKDLKLCGEADHSRVALEEIAKLQPDIVIVDIALKGYSGIELIKGIRRLNPKIRILALSARDESQYALRVFRAGGHGYVMKGSPVPELLDAIRRVGSGEFQISDELTSQLWSDLTRRKFGPEEAACIASLSDRELEIVELIGQGLAVRQIAQQLGMASKTVETHRTHIKEKLHLATGAALTRFCVDWVEDSSTRHPPTE